MDVKQPLDMSVTPTTPSKTRYIENTFIRSGDKKLKDTTRITQHSEHLNMRSSAEAKNSGSITDLTNSPRGEGTPKKKGKLFRAIHSIPLIHLSSLSYESRSKSSPHSPNVSDDSPSSSSKNTGSSGHDSSNGSPHVYPISVENIEHGEDVILREFRFNSLKFFVNKKYIQFSFDDMNPVMYSTFSFKLLGDGVIFCKGNTIECDKYLFSYKLVKKDYVGMTLCYDGVSEYVFKDDCCEDETVLRVYSRNWDKLGLNKSYPVYVRCVDEIHTVKLFLFRHHGVMKYFV